MTVFTLLVATLPALGPVPGASAGPDQPGLVTLDFRDRTIAEVIQAIGARSGNAFWLRPNTLREPVPRITLEAPEPVPFWEAIDRLCAATRLQRQVVGGSSAFRSAPNQVQLHGPPGQVDYGPAQYVGPFRLGPFALHRREDRVFVPAARPLGVRPLKEDVPYYAEFEVLVEPRVIALRTGPVRLLEAVDERGQSLLDRGAAGAESPAVSYPLRASTLQVPLTRPEDPGRRLERIRGVIPAEIGIAPAEPALVVPLAGASGKTFRADDLTIDVREFQVDGTGLAHIKLTVRIEGERGAEKAPKAVLSARAMNVLNHQLELTTERGKLLVASGGASATGPVLAADYTYRTPDGTDRRNPPAVQLRVYTPRWVAWDVPFEFGDLPLP